MGVPPLLLPTVVRVKVKVHSWAPGSQNLPAMLATACNPDEHCLLTVDNGTVSGMPLKQKGRWQLALDVTLFGPKQDPRESQKCVHRSGQWAALPLPEQLDKSESRVCADLSPQLLTTQTPQAHSHPSHGSPHGQWKPVVGHRQPPSTATRLSHENQSFLWSSEDECEAAARL